ncbi:MAG: D-alanyl-D-alanine carboxypeptidase family protein [Acidimicrobiia bacterium]
MRRLVALMLAVGTSTPALAAPVAVPSPPIQGLPHPGPPQVSAPNWILYDQTYGVVLDSRDPDQRRPMASTTKIMTALVALEHAELDWRVNITPEMTRVRGSRIGLVAGETWSMRQLISALAIRSGNDAALAVAGAVAGLVESFVAMMNAEAAELGLATTQFANPHGLDEPGHYSSARDLLVMTLAAMEEPFFAEVARTRRLTFPAQPDGTPRVAEATNHLLEDYPGAFGVKTGETPRSGLVMVVGAERSGRTLYAVVMGSTGSNGHFRDAAELLDYGFEDLGVIPAVAEGELRLLAQGDAPAQPLTVAGTMEALAHLAAAGLSGVVVGSEAPPPASEAQPPARVLPGMGEALAWPARYWEWWVGDG